jgi:hypothetical protein
MATGKPELFTPKNLSSRNGIVPTSKFFREPLVHTVSSHVNMIIATATLATAAPTVLNAQPYTLLSKATTATSKTNVDQSKTSNQLYYTISLTNKGVNAFTVTRSLPIPTNPKKKQFYTLTPNPKKPKTPTKSYPSTLNP